MADITVTMNPTRGAFGRLIDRVRADITRRRDYTRTMNELQRMDTRQMNDLGISRADFDAIARGTFVDRR
ncbi:MAG: DUF1127 domain-containing protein [Azospirillaceae bacterium]